MKEEQQQPNKAQDILQMIRDKQQINPNTIQGFDYLKSIQEDIKLSCDEIIQLVSGRRFCEDEQAPPFEPLTEEQLKLAIIQSVADIIEQVNVYMPRHIQNKPPQKPHKPTIDIKAMIKELEKQKK